MMAPASATRRLAEILRRLATVGRGRTMTDLGDAWALACALDAPEPVPRTVATLSERLDLPDDPRNTRTIGEGVNSAVIAGANGGPPDPQEAGGGSSQGVEQVRSRATVTILSSQRGENVHCCGGRRASTRDANPSRALTRVRRLEGHER